MRYVINLVLGDWSNDGHGRTKTYTIDSNLSIDAINSAYKLGFSLIGHDIVKTVADEYQSTSLCDFIVEALYNNGFAFEDIEVYDKLNNEFIDIELDTDLYLKIYLFVVYLGNPEFSPQIIEQNKINIGGYGLFD